MVLRGSNPTTSKKSWPSPPTSSPLPSFYLKTSSKSIGLRESLGQSLQRWATDAENKINDEEWALRRDRWLAEESLWALHRAKGRRGWARGVGTKARLDHSSFPSFQPVARSPQAAGVGCFWSRWGRGLPTSSHPSKTHSIPWNEIL